MTLHDILPAGIALRQLPILRDITLALDLLLSGHLEFLCLLSWTRGQGLEMVPMSTVLSLSATTPRQRTWKPESLRLETTKKQRAQRACLTAPENPRIHQLISSPVPAQSAPCACQPATTICSTRSAHTAQESDLLRGLKWHRPMPSATRGTPKPWLEPAPSSGKPHTKQNAVHLSTWACTKSCHV